MRWRILRIQVLLCIFVTATTAKLYLIESLKSENSFNQTESNITNTLDNNSSNDSRTTTSSSNDNRAEEEGGVENETNLLNGHNNVDNDDDLITSNESHYIKDIAMKVVVVLLTNLDTASTTSSSSSSSTIMKHKTRWPLWLTNQRPLRQESPVIHYKRQQQQQQQKQQQHHYNQLYEQPTLVALKFNNQHWKLNRLKAAVAKDKGDANDEHIATIAGLEQQSFVTNMPNDIRVQPNIAIHTDVEPKHIVSDDIEANNDNNQQHKYKQQQQHQHRQQQQNLIQHQQPQQVNHLKFYTSNSLPPLSFGQLPQFWQWQQSEQKQQQQQYKVQQQQQQKQQQPLQKQQQHYKPATSLPQEVFHDNHQQQQQQHHHFTDYRLLFNAERHTEFYLYTLTKTEGMLQIRTRTTPRVANTKLATSVAPINATATSSISSNSSSNPTTTTKNAGRVLHVVSDTIGAAFGVNTRPVAGIQGIRIEELELYNAQSLRQSRFNPFNPTRILIHGWLGGPTAGLYTTLIPELFKLQNGSYNIIAIDWGKGAIADYISASYHVKPVGKVLAKFIDFLHMESGITFENIHVIGFSMGAHIAGIAGKFIQTGRLAVIYAIDPAAPLFRYDHVNERVAKTDAEYVEVIHTSVGSYGFDRPLGHVDFYVNYGSSQPGCYFNECSHLRGFQIFAQAIQNEVLEGHGCSEQMWQQLIKMKTCLKETGLTLKMAAENLSKSELRQRRGVYYILTNAHAPFRL